MNTIILKWNPTFSSYSMLDYLFDIASLNRGAKSAGQNWSVWEHDKIQKGDRFYWLKLGLGQVGIVGCGTLSSDPYEDIDWSGRDRQTFYVDLKPEVLLCPEVVEILSSDKLELEIPDFDWRGGHSGVILSRQQTKKLDDLWKEFYKSNLSNWKEIKEKRRFLDTVYLKPRRSSSKSKKEDTPNFTE